MMLETYHMGPKGGKKIFVRYCHGIVDHKFYAVTYHMGPKGG